MLMLQGGGADMPVCLFVPTAVLLAWQCEIISLVRGNCHEQLTTFSDGCLGSINDEGRSEVR
jgi:hypothetical protein